MTTPEVVVVPLFHAVMSQSHIPYTLCVPVAYVSGVVAVACVFWPVPNMMMACFCPATLVQAVESCVVMGWATPLIFAVNNGVAVVLPYFDTPQSAGLLLVRSKRQTFP